jgi:hypothetical protein
VKSEIPVPVNATCVIHLFLSIFTMSNLGYRIVTDADLPLLLRYRQECGWGEEAVKKNWNDPDRIYCVFESIIEGEKQDVGMGCWYLHQPDDLELACRDTHVVHIGESLIMTSSSAHYQPHYSFPSNSKVLEPAQKHYNYSNGSRSSDLEPRWSLWIHWHSS